MPDSGCSRFTDGISIGVLTRVFHRDLVDDVLRETGHAGVRIRLLPGRVVVYFVLALCLFFDDAYEEVMRKLVNGLGFLGNWRGSWHVPTSPAISRARARLGAPPLAALFERVAVPIARPGTTGAWLRDRRLMAVDGVVLDLPDTPVNRAEFGPLTRDGRPRGPFPQVRLAGLGECGTHAIVAAEFDACAVDERALLRRLFPAFTPEMLVMCDRGFYSYELWRDALATGAALLWRLKTDLKIPVVSVLPDGSYLSELGPRRAKATAAQRVTRARAAGRRVTPRDLPEQVRIPVRVIEYTVTNRDTTTEVIKVMTSILDPAAATAAELVTLYQQRWEFELTLDEVEVHQMSASRLLRSKTPELIRQEIWGLLLVHYAVRSFMREAADDADDDVDHLSFIRSIRVIRRQVINQAGFSPSPPDCGNS